MVATRAAKKRRTSKSYDGLIDAGILRSIMSYVGPNEYRFLAGLNVLKWAHKNWGGERYNNWPEYHTEPCQSAAGAGHLDVLIWLRKKGYAWSKDVYAMAQRNGHVHVLKWLKSNGCPVDSDDDSDSDDSLD